jgi:hypothetical protein
LEFGDAFLSMSSTCYEWTRFEPAFNVSLSAAVQDFLDRAKKDFEEAWNRNAKVSE